MYFVVFGTDKPHMTAVRETNRPAHRAYLRDPGQHPVQVRIGGPTFTNGMGKMNGTLLVVEAETIDAVRAFVLDDPYSRAGLFASLEIRPWHWGLDQPEET